VSETPFRLANRLALTVKEAAEVVGVSERHLRSIVPSIPHSYIGSRIIIPVELLKEWLRDQAVTEKLRTDQLADEILESFTKD
jgi:excisionase family DNA binding protein